MSRRTLGSIKKPATGDALIDPMTTRGDVVVRNSSNVTARLAVGAANKVLQSDGTDVSYGTAAVAGGGTGATTLTDGGVLLGSGTGAITATAVLGDGEFIVGDGTTDPVLESGSTARASMAAVGEVSTQVFTSDGTYTKPADLLYAIVEVIGGGGGSGGGDLTGASQVAVPAGGGGGGYAREVLAAGAIGSTETVTVGEGGAAGSSGNNAGSTGETTSFGALLSATGGAGGAGSPVKTAPTLPTIGGAGGVGSGGDVNANSCPGEPGIGMAANNASGGGGGCTPFGAGGARTNTGSTTAAVVGKVYGGGAAAGAQAENQGTAIAGAAGGDGIVIVTEFKT